MIPNEWIERFSQRLQDRWMNDSKYDAEAWTAQVAASDDLTKLFIRFPTDPENAADDDFNLLNS